MKAATDATNTAPAETSFMNCIFGFLSNEIKSIIFSMQVLNISATQTNPIAIAKAAVSAAETLDNSETINTATVAARCKIALCPLPIYFLIPAIAYLKLLTRSANENFFDEED